MFSGTELCEEETFMVKVFSMDTASDPGPPPMVQNFQDISGGLWTIQTLEQV